MEDILKNDLKKMTLEGDQNTNEHGLCLYQHATFLSTKIWW